LPFQKGNNANPSGKGGFKKGQSGNPGGQSKAMASAVADVRAQAAGGEAVAKLIQLMRSAENEQVQRMAAEALLDRGFGRPEAKSTVDMNLKQEFADALVSVGIRTTDSADEGMAERPGAVH
jgi:hypothetical protein